jgi:hypothetical protein
MVLARGHGQPFSRPFPAAPQEFQPVLLDHVRDGQHLVNSGALIGGCPMHSMACRKVAFPSITVISILLLIGSGFYALYLARKKGANV